MCPSWSFMKGQEGHCTHQKIHFFSYVPQLETRFSLSSPELTRQNKTENKPPQREKNTTIPHFHTRVIFCCINSAKQLACLQTGRTSAHGSTKYTLETEVDRTAGCSFWCQELSVYCNFLLKPVPWAVSCSLICNLFVNYSRIFLTWE